MVVAVALVGMMEVAFYEVVFVAAVGNRFVAASRAVRVLAVVGAARMSRGA